MLSSAQSHVSPLDRTQFMAKRDLLAKKRD
jgi:hypothetical protein